MIMIASILLIPSSLLHGMLIPLLDVVDLVRFDTAVMNHNLRTLFLSQFQGARLMAQSLPIDNEVARWILHKSMVVTELHISTKAIDLTIVKQLAASGCTLVSFDNCASVKEEYVLDVIQASSNVKSICCRQLIDATNFVNSVSQSCVSVESIDISGCRRMNLHSVNALTAECKMLTEINLNDCIGWMDNTCATKIAINCPQLQKLSLDLCNKCDDQTLQLLSQYCRNLRFLSCQHVYSISDIGVGALATGCTELQTFLILGNENITSTGIITLAKGCTKLEEIGIPDCDEHIDQAVAALVQYCPALNTLRCHATAVSDTSLQHFQNCSLLHTLELIEAYMTTTALMHVLNSCILLQSLTFSGGLKVDAGAVCPLLRREFPSLQCFSLADCTALKDADFIPLIAKCPNITELTLRDCTRLTEASVLAVAFHFRQLQRISLISLPVSDVAIATLVQSCPDLRSICSTCNELLTDAAASAIAQHCKYLTNLDMSFCSKITDVGIKDILQKCRKLSTIVLRGCEQINSFNVANDALTFGAHLRMLDLRSCSKLSEQNIATFRSLKPHCALLTYPPGMFF